MEINYGIPFLYQSIGKLYVEGETYKAQIEAMAQQLSNQARELEALRAEATTGTVPVPGVDSLDAVSSSESHQAAPVDQDGTESSTAGVSDHART